MLSRKNRISTEDFPSFSNKGKRFFSPLFSATVYPTTLDFKASVVVSKKTAKTAVSRNRTRRQFYAILETLLKKLKKNTMIVFFPKTEALTAPKDQLKKEIVDTLNNAKILD